MWVGTEKRAQQGVEQKSQSLRVAEGTETEVTHSVRRGARLAPRRIEWVGQVFLGGRFAA